MRRTLVFMLACLVAGIVIGLVAHSAGADPILHPSDALFQVNMPANLNAYKVEYAIADQVDSEVRRFWDVAPLNVSMSFSRTAGIPVYFVPHGQLDTVCNQPGAQGIYGCHGQLGPDMTLAIYVALGVSGEETVTLDHEILETLVDPWASNDQTTYRDRVVEEVCDPVEGAVYHLDGVWLADFVTPSYFAHGYNQFHEPRGSESVA